MSITPKVSILLLTMFLNLGFAVSAKAGCATGWHCVGTTYADVPSGCNEKYCSQAYKSDWPKCNTECSVSYPSAIYCDGGTPPNCNTHKDTYKTNCCEKDASASPSPSSSCDKTSVPTVDLKINGSDIPIVIPYNTAATLSWTSTDADSCKASDGWTGTKAVSGSESTGKVTANKTKTYTLKCKNCYGKSNPDSVSVDTLDIVFRAIPPSGIRPLEKVDLRATVGGTATGTINYKFDCDINSGSGWDYVFDNIPDTSKTVVDACNYPLVGSYTAKVQVERGNGMASKTTVISVYSPPTVDLKINNTDGPAAVPYNGSAVLSWVSHSAGSCKASGDWSGAKTTFGRKTVNNITTAKTYTLTCSHFVFKQITAQDSVSAYVENRKPTASFSCDASLCGPGSSSGNCIGYQKCVFTGQNLCSDPDGLDDIKTSFWELKDEGVVKDSFACPPGESVLCNYALPTGILPPKIYALKLTVVDSAGNNDSVSKDITLRSEISPDFVCSKIDPKIDNTKWQACDSWYFKPARNSTVWLSDNLDDNLLTLLGLTGKKSVLSEGATKFTKRVWKQNNVVFNSCDNPLGCANSNISFNIDRGEITLEIQDNIGRTGSKTYQVYVSSFLPWWEEIPPFSR